MSLPFFRLGLGATIGDGPQYMSWISLEDQIRIIYHVIEDKSLAGPVNCVTPNPVTNAEFTRTLADVLHRPAFLRIPSFVFKMLPGNMADEAMLSMRVIPKVLQASGFEFKYPQLRSALEHELN